MFEDDVEYFKDLHQLHDDLSSLPERIKIKKCHKLVCNLYNKKVCCTHKNFKTCTKHGLILKKFIY